MSITPQPRTGLFARFRQNRALALMVLLLVLFSGLAFFARSAGLLHIDTAITRELQEGHSSPLDFLAYFFTFLGNGLTMTTLCLIAAFLLFRTGRPKAAWFAVFTMLGEPLNMLLKQIVHRPRPTADLVRVFYTEQGDSFPSGHAMCSTIVYGFLAYLAWTFIKDAPRRRFWAALLALLPVGISASRIYLGVHWFSDIIGAWMFGLVVLIIFAELYKKLGANERAVQTPIAPLEPENASPSPPARETGPSAGLLGGQKTH